METFILTAVVLGVIIAAMSIGVIMGRKPIKGSCGGVGAAMGEKNYTCPVCGDNPDKCENDDDPQQKTVEEDGQAYEAKSSKQP